MPVSEWASRHDQEEVRNREKHGEKGKERRGDEGGGKQKGGQREHDEWTLNHPACVDCTLFDCIINIAPCSTLLYAT